YNYVKYCVINSKAIVINGFLFATNKVDYFSPWLFVFQYSSNTIYLLGGIYAFFNARNDIL
ncbi:hypothetical protein J9231_10380, partial [Providencia rettgeri]|uniref:hypothetical protein n=1 Tax=Providencia rettgeri TaxID=587 RepID=UPI001B398202